MMWVMPVIAVGVVLVGIFALWITAPSKADQSLKELERQENARKVMSKWTSKEE